MATEQMAFRLYPIGYTGNSLAELNELLVHNKWRVKMALPEIDVCTGGKSNTKHILILEREID